MNVKLFSVWLGFNWHEICHGENVEQRNHIIGLWSTLNVSDVPSYCIQMVS